MYSFDNDRMVSPNRISRNAGPSAPCMHVVRPILAAAPFRRLLAIPQWGEFILRGASAPLFSFLRIEMRSIRRHTQESRSLRPVRELSRPCSERTLQRVPSLRVARPYRLNSE